MKVQWEPRNVFNPKLQSLTNWLKWLHVVQITIFYIDLLTESMRRRPFTILSERQRICKVLKYILVEDLRDEGFEKRKFWNEFSVPVEVSKSRNRALVKVNLRSENRIFLTKWKVHTHLPSTICLPVIMSREWSKVVKILYDMIECDLTCNRLKSCLFIPTSVQGSYLPPGY